MLTIFKTRHLSLGVSESFIKIAQTTDFLQLRKVGSRRLRAFMLDRYFAIKNCIFYTDGTSDLKFAPDLKEA